MRNSVSSILILFLFLLSCKGKKAPEGTESSRIDKTVKRFEVVETIKGKKMWNLKADRAEVSSDTTLIYNVNLSFYDREGEISSILTSDSGYVFPSGNMLAKGNVVVTSMESGRVLKTRRLSWDQKRERIISEDSVVILTEDGIIKGKGLEANQDLTEIKIMEMEAKGE